MPLFAELRADQKKSDATDIFVLRMTSANSRECLAAAALVLLCKDSGDTPKDPTGSSTVFKHETRSEYERACTKLGRDGFVTAERLEALCCGIHLTSDPDLMLVREFYDAARNLSNAMITQDHWDMLRQDVLTAPLVYRMRYEFDVRDEKLLTITYTPHIVL